jgi:DNA/RNA-binding domain of Phe-tRNA-synthetase-like protein
LAVQLVLEQPFCDLLREASIGVVVVSGIDNRRPGEAVRSELIEAAAAATAVIGDGEFAGSPAIAVWREAYRRFGVKPSDYRSGIEGLLRAARRGEVRSVNPLVDCYNAVSLRHLLPCGGEDLDALVGDLRLTRARGDEQFVPLGGDASSPPKPGEVVYADDAGIVCRAWNWREAERTKLTRESTRAVLVIEALPPRTAAEVTAACAELAGMVTSHLGGESRVALLGANGVLETPLHG